jgi:integrase
MGKLRIPRLCQHRASGRGYVTNPRTGLEEYLGDFGTPECRKNYERWVERWRLSLGGEPTVFVKGGQETVADLIIAFLRFARKHYRKDDEPTSELGVYVALLGPFNELCGDKMIREFRPSDFKAARQLYIENGLCRHTVNGYCRRIRRLFRWGVGEEIVHSDILVAISSIEPLQKGRTAAPERPKIKPVSLELFEQTLPGLNARTQTLARLHYLLGCRAGEIVRMRPTEIDRASTPWIWRPRHKNEHRGTEREIPIGPEARALLSPLLADAWVFPSQRHRGRSHLTVRGYYDAILAACRRLKLPRWTPLQVRHARLTAIRQRYGIEAAQAIGGHSQLNTTEIYAARLDELARRIAEETG